MDYFSDIVGHEKILKILRRAILHPAGAYLFFGPYGAPSREAALAFASALLKIDLGLDSHPDFIRVLREEGKKQISVEQARALVNRMTLSSGAGGFKIALIESAEQLHMSAINALLKAVEEPGKGAVYIFVTEDAEALPLTLRSRLVPILFRRDPAQRREESTDARELLRTLESASLGARIAGIEALHKECESQEEPEKAWRQKLSALMHLAFSDGDPKKRVALSAGLILAWRFVGSPIPPRLGLEWTAVMPYYKGNVPSLLKPFL